MHPGPGAQQPSSAPGNGCCGSLGPHLQLQGPAAGLLKPQDAHAAGSVEGMPVQLLVAQLDVAVVVVRVGVVAAVPVAVGSVVIAVRH